MSTARRRWLLGLAYACAILAMSSIPARAMPKNQTLWQFDKVVHAVEYGGLALLVFRAWRSSAALSPLRIGLLTFGMCGIFGGMDELYQATTPGRDSSLYDVMADSIGAAVVCILCIVFYSRQKD